MLTCLLVRGNLDARTVVAIEDAVESTGECARGDAGNILGASGAFGVASSGGPGGAGRSGVSITHLQDILDTSSAKTSCIQLIKSSCIKHHARILNFGYWAL